ncbi:MAG: hypothetical protein AAFX06_04200 [Planctomycetota bacterium]
MSTAEPVATDSRTMQLIDSVIDAREDLRAYRPGLEVTIEETRIVLKGHLPSEAHRQALVRAVRQAGALGQICNLVTTG